jgi:hypothetical protein
MLGQYVAVRTGFEFIFGELRLRKLIKFFFSMDRQPLGGLGRLIVFRGFTMAL